MSLNKHVWEYKFRLKVKPFTALLMAISSTVDINIRPCGFIGFTSVTHRERSFVLTGDWLNDKLGGGVVRVEVDTENEIMFLLEITHI